MSEQLDNPDDLLALDEIAALTADDVPDVAAVRDRYQADERLRMDGSLLSFVDGTMVPVTLDDY